MNETELKETITSLQAQSLLHVQVEPSYEALLRALEERINHLINLDFSSLIQVLYRIDVPENELRSMLAGTAGQSAGRTIAVMIIRRELQKIATRNSFKRYDDIPDAEKW